MKILKSFTGWVSTGNLQTHRLCRILNKISGDSGFYWKSDRSGTPGFRSFGRKNWVEMGISDIV